ncbi:MAG TPA: efflux RND transporter periplasmic adaptor subunit [Steroidobacteraceae bacterium]|nr:efflux RND transporter periplasmic adaptor subunit [Steroidobacteraceae bacterium]
MTMDRALPKPRFRPSVLIAAAVAVALLAFILIAQPFNVGRTVRMRAVAVSVAPVEHGVFRDFVPLRGRIVPRDIVYLDAQEGGRVERVLVEAGDVVTAGQPLLEFGNTELQLEVIDRETRLIEQINNLRGTQTALEQNRVANEKTLVDIDYNIVRLTRLTQRRTTLAARGATSAEEKEKAVDELAYYRQLRPLHAATSQKQEAMRLQRVPEIGDGLAKLRQNLAITRGKLDNLIVRAPLAGRLTEMDLKVGQNCERGRRLAEITPDAGFKLAADVDEFYLGRLRTGQSAAVRINDADWTLHVTRVYPQVKNGTFLVDLAFDGEQPADVLPGQAVQGKLALGSDSQGLVLAAGAFLERSGGDWVFVLTDDDTAQRRRVRLGRRNADQVEILGGLAAGDRVIVSDYAGLERIERIELTH